MTTKKFLKTRGKPDDSGTMSPVTDEAGESNTVPIQPHKEPTVATKTTNQRFKKPTSNQGTAPGVSVGNAPKLTFPVNAMGSLAPAVRVISKSVQVAPVMTASVLIAILAAIFQALFNVSRNDSGDGAPLSLYMFVIAESGERKSSTIQAITDPLYKALRKVADQRRQMMVQDITVDGLVKSLISRCPSQMLLVPEAATLLSGHAMNKDNLMRFLGTVSALYSGEAISRTRVDGHDHAEDRRLSSLIMSQPLVALAFVSSEAVMQQGTGNRFLYAAPESLRGTRFYNDHDLNSDPDYAGYCQFIGNAMSKVMKIDEETGGISPKVIRLSPDAKSIWIDHYNALEDGCSEGGPYASHVGYVTRFSEQTLRLACILTLIEDLDADEVTADAMTRAIRLANYYLKSALQLFIKAPADNDELHARTLLNWMSQKETELDLPAIPVRMIYKDGPRCARPGERARKLLTILEERGEVCKYEGTVNYSGSNASEENYSTSAD